MQSSSCVRTYQKEYIKSVLTHPTIWPHISRGVDIEPEEYDFDIEDDEHFLKVEGGLFILHPYQDGMQIHANMIERGDVATRGVAQVIEYAKENNFKALYAIIPEINPNVRAFAARSGFSEYQVKDGKHYMKLELAK